MINAVRNTVLAILNKNNYGYISPSDFNLFAKQAQLDIFDEYFINYNTQINRENSRISGTGYANATKGYDEVINTFSTTGSLGQFGANTYIMPTEATTGFDYYLLNKVLVYSAVVSSGTTTGTSGNNTIVDSTATFVTDGVAIGDRVSVAVNAPAVTNYTVTDVVDENNLTVNVASLTTSPLTYGVYKPANLTNEAELVTQSNITLLNTSLLTAPTVTYPSYSQEGENITVYPDTINTVGRVVSQYIRYPKDPKWTYLSLAGGEPVFDQSQSDYQDFELPMDDSNNLVIRILQYAGISIQELEVYQFGATKEQQENQEE